MATEKAKGQAKPAEEDGLVLAERLTQQLVEVDRAREQEKKDAVMRLRLLAQQAADGAKVSEDTLVAMLAAAGWSATQFAKEIHACRASAERNKKLRRLQKVRDELLPAAWEAMQACDREFAPKMRAWEAEMARLRTEHTRLVDELMRGDLIGMEQQNVKLASQGLRDKLGLVEWQLRELEAERERLKTERANYEPKVDSSRHDAETREEAKVGLARVIARSAEVRAEIEKLQAESLVIQEEMKSGGGGGSGEDGGDASASPATESPDGLRRENWPEWAKGIRKTSLEA